MESEGATGGDLTHMEDGEIESDKLTLFDSSETAHQQPEVLYTTTQINHFLPKKKRNVSLSSYFPDKEKLLSQHKIPQEITIQEYSHHADDTDSSAYISSIEDTLNQTMLFLWIYFKWNEDKTDGAIWI